MNEEAKGTDVSAKKKKKKEGKRRVVFKPFLTGFCKWSWF